MNSLFELVDGLEQDRPLTGVGDSNVLVLNVPFRSDRTVNDHLGLARDYLLASFVGQRLATHCRSVRFMTLRSGSPPKQTISYTFQPQEANGLEAEVHMLLTGLSDHDVGEAEEFEEALDRYEAELLYGNTTVRFPSLVDDYFSHLVPTVLDRWDEPSIQRLLDKHPGILYGFWRSPRGAEVGYEVHVSSYCWIVPRDVDVRKVLRAYSPANGEPIFEEALPVAVNNKQYLITGQEALQLNTNLMNAARSGALMISERWNGHREGHLVELMDMLYEERPVTYLVDRQRRILLCLDRSSQLVLFGHSILGFQQVVKVQDEVRAVLDQRGLVNKIVP